MQSVSTILLNVFAIQSFVHLCYPSWLPSLRATYPSLCCRPRHRQIPSLCYPVRASDAFAAATVRTYSACCLAITTGVCDGVGPCEGSGGPAGAALGLRDGLSRGSRWDDPEQRRLRTLFAFGYHFRTAFPSRTARCRLPRAHPMPRWMGLDGESGRISRTPALFFPAYKVRFPSRYTPFSPPSRLRSGLAFQNVKRAGRWVWISGA